MFFHSFVGEYGHCPSLLGMTLLWKVDFGRCISLLGMTLR